VGVAVPVPVLVRVGLGVAEGEDPTVKVGVGLLDRVGVGEAEAGEAKANRAPEPRGKAAKHWAWVGPLPEDPESVPAEQEVPTSNVPPSPMAGAEAMGPERVTLHMGAPVERLKARTWGVRVSPPNTYTTPRLSTMDAVRISWLGMEVDHSSAPVAPFSTAVRPFPQEVITSPAGPNAGRHMVVAAPLYDQSMAPVELLMA